MTFSFWQGGRKTKDYDYIDRMICEFMFRGGTAVYVHKYLGTEDQNGNAAPSLATIEDVLLLENRDRKYDSSIYELRGTYNVQDNDLDLRQFGAFFSGDTMFIEFHLNDMIGKMGRRLVAGDVLELAHLRDDTVPDDMPAINKFYVVQEASRATDGYSSTWLPHIWRVKVGPIANTQEYSSILNQQAVNPLGQLQGGTLIDILSTMGIDKSINDQIVAMAKQDVSARNFETRQYYVIPGDETTTQNPWVFAGDGVPPNGAALLGSGCGFPLDASNGDYFLRTDSQPHSLYRKTGSTWALQEIDYRTGDWSAARRLLETFINNPNQTVLPDGSTFSEKQSLYKSVALQPDKLP